MLQLCRTFRNRLNGILRMEAWMKTTLMLSVYGVLKENRPSYAYSTKYYTHPPLNFTVEQVNRNINPISIYSEMIFSVVTFVITDLARYKPIIILQSASGMVSFFMRASGQFNGIFIIQIGEVVYGLFAACDVAYTTYLYAKVDSSRYQMATSYTRFAHLVGRTLGGLIAQTLVFFGFSYYSLYLFSFCSVTLSGIWSLFLPKAESSVYFNPVKVDLETGKLIKPPLVEKLTYGYKKLWVAFVSAFKSFYVIQWACWWTLATCCYYQCLVYIQSLFEQILEGKHQEAGNLNGIAETASCLIGAAGVYGFGKLQLDWSRYGEIFLCVGSLLIAAVLIALARTTSIIAAFIFNVLFVFIYNCMITISLSEMAKKVNPDSYGLIFGFTSFVALLLESLFTLVVIEGMNLDGRTQFFVYGGYFAVLSTIFAVKTTYDLIQQKHSVVRQNWRFNVPTTD